MASSAKDDSNNLNELLEDALEDLLLDDDTKPSSDPKAEQDDDLAGKPNIKESLKKITQVNETGAGTTSSTTTIDEDEMNKFFASMTEKLKAELPKIDPSEAQARISESVPQIFDLMQNLLSKELLYPALKDLSPKFEEWLQKNLATLSKDDRRRYKKQLSKIHAIIDVFDDESLEDQERFEKNLELMEQMQALGAPPEELTVPDGMSRCSIM
jgi:hypothetical protein